MSIVSRLIVAAVFIVVTTAIFSAPATGQSTRVSERDIRSAPPAVAATNVVAFSPDGTQIATVTKSSQIAVWDVDTGA